MKIRICHTAFSDIKFSKETLLTGQKELEKSAVIFLIILPDSRRKNVRNKTDIGRFNLIRKCIESLLYMTKACMKADCQNMS